MKKLFVFVLLLSFLPVLAQQIRTPLPTKYQLAWHEQEFYLYIHFGPNTFTDKEWGHGDEAAEVFNPSSFDCRQWCRVAKAAGAKAIIITAKHHDGFCLWPSKFSTHTVRESKWRNGKGDVLKDLSKACKEYGLRFGVYISPWDRNHPDYGTEKYNDVFVGMMKELFQNYGPIWELWWDGANGEGPNGKKQVYDWKRYRETVRKISPSTVIFSDVGPDIRWCGNENGIAGETNWNYLDTEGFEAGAKAPKQDILNTGNKDGKYWIPAECDVSIRPGWFYHKEEDSKVKTPEQLFQLYLKSVGRGANLLLNVPPDRRGLIHENDSAALAGFRKLREQAFKENLAVNGKTELVSGDSLKPTLPKQSFPLDKDKLEEQSIYVFYKKPTEINCIEIGEDIKFGQMVEQFYVQLVNGSQVQSFMYSTIGRKRIITFPAFKAESVMIKILSAKGDVRIKDVQTFLIPEVK
jgi:alpha-L-fucosidase